MAEDLNDILRRDGPGAIRAKLDAAFVAGHKANSNGHLNERGHRGCVVNPFDRRLKANRDAQTETASKAPPIPALQLLRIAREIQIRLIPWDEITLSIAPQFLIRDLYPLTGLAVVYGPPKEGKTFFVFDTVMHIALGWPYRGRRVMQGPVVYCLFEGQRNFAARKEAFRQHHLMNHGEKIPFYLVSLRLQLVQDHPRLIDAIKAQIGETVPRAVAIDTLNRSFTGDENSTQAMTEYVSACDAIRESFDCLTIIVHHSGLEGGRSRGSTALLGAADAQIGVKKNDNGQIEAAVEYMKDGPDGLRLTSRLNIVEVGVDENGDPITSCVVTPAEEAEQQAPREKPKKPNAAHDAFNAAFNEIVIASHLDHHPMGDGPLVKAARVEAVRDEFYRRYVTGEPDKTKAADARRTAFNRALKQLREARLYHTEVKDGVELIWR